MIQTRRQLLASAAIVAPVRTFYSQQAKSPLERATTLLDFEPLARERLSNMAFEYIVRGAGSEITLRSNREAATAVQRLTH